MIPVRVKEVDQELVLLAGAWLALIDEAAPTDEDRALAASCAVVEAELREREWTLFEQLVPHTIDGRVVPPANDAERLRILKAVVALGLHHRVPKGRAQEAGIA